MKSVNQNLVFRQYLSNLPTNILACPLANYDAKKLTDFSVVKIFIMASLQMGQPKDNRNWYPFKKGVSRRNWGKIN